MRSLREWIRRLLGTLQPGARPDGDLEEELRLHEQLATEDARRRGLDPRDAVRAARIRIGGTSQAMDALRDQRGLPWLDDLSRDVRQALRTMRRAPGFSAVALLTLALGIGANAAIFTLIDAVLLKSLPVPEPEGLVLLGDARARGVGVGLPAQSRGVYSYDLYAHLREAGVFAGLSAFDSSGNEIRVRRTGWTAPQPTSARLVSGNYFQVLGVSSAAGRTLVPADEAPSARPVAVVSYRYWQTALNGEPSAIGDTLELNGVPVAIVGVAAAEFYGERIEPDPPSIWLPISVARALDPAGHLLDSPDLHWLYLMGRLQPGHPAPQAQASLTLALRNWLRARAGSPVSIERQARIDASRVELTPGGGGIPHLQRNYSQTLRLLLGISMAVLLLACANIAGLLLARGLGRRSERSLRLALGASRGRLVRQSLAETLTLALAGGVLALFVAAAAARLLLALVFRDVDYVPVQTTPDARVLAFTFALSCAAAVVCGLLPAIRMRTDIGSSLRGVRFRMGKAIVIAQVAVSLMVLAGAAALANSLMNLTMQPFGFDRTRVLVARVDPAVAGYDYSGLAPLYQQLESRLNSLPGVESAGFSYYSPFNGCCWAFSVTVPGYARGPDEDTVTLLNRVSPRYFETFGTKVLRGRRFDDRDTPASRRVIVVNDAFVQRYCPDANPLGRTVIIDGTSDAALEIVGVVDNAKYDEPREGMRPMVFLPLLQMQAGEPATSGHYQSNFITAIAVRAAGDPAAMAAAVRRTLTDLDPRLTLLRVETLSYQVGQTLRQEQATAMLAGTFGLLALGLTSIGLYGVMAYVVQRRRREIGVRVALGADRRSVIAMVVREALAQALIGVLLGVPMAFAATRLLANQLYGVGATNPVTVASATLVLVACLTVAGYLPAWRAARLNPNLVLRAD